MVRRPSTGSTPASLPPEALTLAEPLEALQAAVADASDKGDPAEPPPPEMLAHQPPALDVGDADQHVDGIGAVVPRLHHRDVEGPQLRPRPFRLDGAGEHDRRRAERQHLFEHVLLLAAGIAGLRHHQAVTGALEGIGTALDGVGEVLILQVRNEHGDNR